MDLAPVLGKRAIDACGMQPPEGPGTNTDQARVTTPPRRLRWPNRYSSRARSGFVGSSLTEALEAEGYSVLAMTRHPDTYAGAGKPIFGDVYEPDSLRSALADADAALLPGALAGPGRTSSRKTLRRLDRLERRRQMQVLSG